MRKVQIDYNVKIGTKMGASMDAWIAKQAFKWCKEQYPWFAEACEKGQISLEGNKVVSSGFSIPFEDCSIIFDWTEGVYKQFKPAQLSVRNVVHVTDDDGGCNPRSVRFYIANGEADATAPAAYRFRRLMDIRVGKFDCVTESGETREYYYQMVGSQEAFLLGRNFLEEKNPHNVALCFKKDERTTSEVVEIWPLSTLKMDEDTLADKMDQYAVKTENAIIKDEFFLAVGGYHAMPLLDSEGNPVSMLETMDVQRTFAGTRYEDWTFEGIEYEFGKVEPLVPVKAAKKAVQEEFENLEQDELENTEQEESEETEEAEFDEEGSTLIVNLHITFKKENGEADCELAKKIFDWCCERYSWFGEKAKKKAIYLSDSKLESSFTSTDRYLDEEPIAWMEEVFEQFHPAQMDVCTQYERYEGPDSDYRYIIASVENGKFVVKDDFVMGQADCMYGEGDYVVFNYRNEGCYGLLLGDDPDPAFATTLCFRKGQETHEEVVEIWPDPYEEMDDDIDMDDIKSCVRRVCFCLAICDSEIPLLDCSGNKILDIKCMDPKRTFEGTKFKDYEFVGIRYEKDAEPKSLKSVQDEDDDLEQELRDLLE